MLLKAIKQNLYMLLIKLKHGFELFLTYKLIATKPQIMVVFQSDTILAFVM